MFDLSKFFPLPTQATENEFSSFSTKNEKQPSIVPSSTSTLSCKEESIITSNFFNSNNRDFSTTTYAQPYYFSYLKKSSTSPSYLIKERKVQEELIYENPQLLFGIKFHLKPVGSLKQNQNGLVYLTISDDYIHKLYPFFSGCGAQKPSLQAHIPIISDEEWLSLDGKEIKELGSDFSFKIKECKRISPENWPEMHYVWILTVESPELERLRESYNLPSKLQSQFFTILLAVKPLEAPKDSVDNSYHFKINPACCCV